MNTENRDQPGDRPDGVATDRAWESAMSRDFDARVRSLTEAPLTLDAVKGKAGRIRRNRRIAAAGGALAVAAAVTPVALIAVDDGDVDSSPAPATRGVEDPAAATAPDYLVDGVWHQSDGDEVAVPAGDYYAAAAIWDSQLVVQRAEEEDVSHSITEILDADGNVVDSFGSHRGVAVADDGSFLAYVSSDGELTARSADGETVLADGLELNMAPVAATGDAACGGESDTCTVYVNDGDGPPRVYSSHGFDDEVTADAEFVNDATDGLVSLVDEIDEMEPATCGGVHDQTSGDFVFRGCDFQVHQFSPDGRYVAATQSYFDGLGPVDISVLDARTGAETGRWAVDGATVPTWAWSPDGRLVFQAYDGASWHLYAMRPDGEVEELTDPVRASDVDAPFTVIAH